MNLVIVGQLFSTFFMTGLIWLIQLVHYPAFHRVDSKRFSEFESFHSRTITWIVLPVMSMELVISIYLMVEMAGTYGWWVGLTNLGTVGFLWIYTLLVSARIHGQLAAGYNEQLVNKLVRTNWARTVVWSLRSVFWILIAMNWKS